MHSSSHAQCSANINTFPYNEGFETSPGNWFVTNYSISSDWEWNNPSRKTTINTAGGGNRCWTVGDSIGNGYSSGEDSYLQSPCFDISSLANPYISFKIFWDSEQRFDGTGFQYSTDGGNTWINLGSNADAINCPASNWFNTSSIRYLSAGEGWSGSSGKWVTAQHSLSNVTGATNITFRFVFGAGTINNNYNGVGIDDIFIGEAPPFGADFNFNCSGNKAVSFTDASINCPTTFAWNFGDPASGAANTDTRENPTHTFSAAGTYTVSFTASSPTSTPATVTKQISILDVSVTSTNVTCGSTDDGTATAHPTGGLGTYTYSWDTNPNEQTQTINNLIAGTYTVTVNATNGCAASASATITAVPPIAGNITTVDEICGNGKGSADASISGGVTPYRYTWSNGQTTQNVSNLSSGTYSLHVSDNGGCSKDFNNVKISNVIPKLNVLLEGDTGICPGQQLILHAGNFSSYLWQDNSTASTFTVTSTGTYSVQVIDNNGCTGSDSAHVDVDCTYLYFPSAFTPNSDGRNDTFGPVGDITALKNYTLTVYDRWGNIIFRSNDPLQKWDGTYKGTSMNAGTYVWVSSFIFNYQKPETRKGSITIIR